MNKSVKLLSLFTLYLIGLTLSSSASAGAVENPSKKPNPIALKNLFKDDFTLGTSFNFSHFREPSVLNHINKHFNCLTTENEFKWSSINPKPHIYNFEKTDKILRFAKKNKMDLIGHTLLWKYKSPAWRFTNEQGNAISKEALLKRIKKHIFTVVGRYKGQIKGWDVVNEVFNSDGTYRKTEFYKILGKDYIKKAYQWVKEADPETEIYYNDYGLYGEKKLQATVNLVHELRQEGIHLDAVGFQAHLMLDWPHVDSLERAITQLHASKVKVMITELDVTVLPSGFGKDVRERHISQLTNHAAKLNPYTLSLPNKVQDTLAKRYREIFKTLLKHQDKISRVTLWGANDKINWMNNWPIKGRTDHATLFDRNNQAKKAFHELIKIKSNHEYTEKGAKPQIAWSRNGTAVREKSYCPSGEDFAGGD